MNLRSANPPALPGSPAGDRRSTGTVPTAAQRWPHASALRLRRLADLAPTLLLRSPLYRLMSRRFFLYTGARGQVTGAASRY